MRRRTAGTLWVRRIAALPQLPDYLAPGLDVIFVGINPGVQSARAGHYYANPRNPFWRLLHKAGLTPRQLRPDEDHLLPSFGYGITDIVKHPSRGVGDLTAADFRRGRRILEEKLRACQPRIVCFNSKTGFVNFFGPGVFSRMLMGLFQQPVRRFGRQEVTIGASRVFVMPSTSPANAGTPLAMKLRYFRALRRWRDSLTQRGLGVTGRTNPQSLTPDPRPPRGQRRPPCWKSARWSTSASRCAPS
ncbi:MAG: mismatch-specific DNA-glycosylase [candidate division NC10 bacterium]|nr:mismatch-specific DNA-glycosylase [candidate division NC10 bacterium]